MKAYIITAERRNFMGFETERIAIVTTKEKAEQKIAQFREENKNVWQMYENDLDENYKRTNIHVDVEEVEIE